MCTHHIILLELSTQKELDGQGMLQAQENNEHKILIGNLKGRYHLGDKGAVVKKDLSKISCEDMKEITWLRTERTFWFHSSKFLHQLNNYQLFTDNPVQWSVTRVTRGCDILHHYTVNLEYCEKLKSQQ